MRIIGDKSVFAIEYELFNTEKDNVSIWHRLQGTMSMYVYEKNICEYLFNEKEFTYNGVLYYIVDWLCENLSNIVGYDPYPMPVEAENVLELISKANEFETNDELEEYLWYSSEQNWIFRHSWRAVSETAIPSVFFRRKGEFIEISWDNEYWKEHKVIFTSQIGSKLVRLDVFRTVIIDFLIAIIADITINDHNSASKVKEWLLEIRMLIFDVPTENIIKEIMKNCNKF